MKAIILAAGYGTRLGHLTEHCAKPLLEVDGKPLVEHIVEKIRKLGQISDIYIVSNAKFYEDFKRWSLTYDYDSLHILNDGTLSKEDRLGSIGDVHFVIEKENIQEDVLIIGGDNFFDDDLQEFVKYFTTKGSSILVHNVKSKRTARELGIVTLDDSDKIVNFEEKPDHPASTLASTSIYLIKNDHLHYIKSALNQGFADRAGDFIKYLSERKNVYGKTIKGDWYDIGTRQQLERAKKRSLSMSIAIFGTGYVGLVTGACLANLGHSVICVDIDEEKIQKLDQGIIPFYEPGLQDLVTKNKEKGRLEFTTNAQETVEKSDVIFNCVGTPSKEDGSADLQYVFAVVRTVAEYANAPKVLINKSTVPPGTAKRCHEIVDEVGPANKVHIVSNPEFLKEGNAVYDFTHPDKIVIGTKRNPSVAAIVRQVYSGRIRTYIPILETTWETAEIIKYANNCFLATKISFINELANISDKVGADIRLVAQAMGLDYRISPKFLSAGVGYGGSCFPKDVRALINTSQRAGYDSILLKAVDTRNEIQKRLFIEKITGTFGEDLSAHSFTIWGLSFKPKTSDVRESPSLVIIEELIKRNATVQVYDPVSINEAQKMLEGTKNIVFCNSMLESVKGSSGIILVTEWDEFRNVDLELLGDFMKHKMVFDGRNIYEPDIVREEGFEYVGVGRK